MTLPQAACFVVPNISQISDYRSAKRDSITAWIGLKTKTKAAILLPNDTSPHEVSACLHEELAQTLRPLNDLYRLPDQVFNNDNVHTVLTSFGMLTQRTHYPPELHSGMSRRATRRSNHGSRSP